MSRALEEAPFGEEARARPRFGEELLLLPFAQRPTMKEAPATILRKGVLYASDKTTVLDCLFCRIIAGKEPATSVTPLVPNPDLFAFKTIAPATHTHILVSPRRHIQNIDALSAADVPLLQEMKAYGLSLLRADQQKDALLCFHCPPWNSIDHLHLHVIADRSSMTFFNGFFKYLPKTSWCQDIDSVLSRLQQSNGHNK